MLRSTLKEKFTRELNDILALPIEERIAEISKLELNEVYLKLINDIAADDNASDADLQLRQHFFNAMSMKDDAVVKLANDKIEIILAKAEAVNKPADVISEPQTAVKARQTLNLFKDEKKKKQSRYDEVFGPTIIKTTKKN